MDGRLCEAARTRRPESSPTCGSVLARSRMLRSPSGAGVTRSDWNGSHARPVGLSRPYEQRCGLPRSQVALCFSHTHSGPVVGKGLEPLHYRQLDRAAADAHGRVRRGAAAADRGVCRTGAGRSGSVRAAVGIRHGDVCGQSTEQCRTQSARIASERAVTGALRPRRARTGGSQSGRALEVHWFGYACHATTLDDYMWCGDYPGFAAQDLENRYPACVALFWAGCGADQNPLPRRRLELAQQYGGQLAEAVAGVLANGNGLQPLPATLNTAYVEVSLPLSQIPNQEELQQAAQSPDRYVRARAAMYLERLAAGQSLPTTYPFPVQVWVLGEQVQLVFLGGEVVVDYALRLKAELRGKPTWVAGYANDVMAYIPSRRVLHGGRLRRQGCDGLLRSPLGMDSASRAAHRRRRPRAGPLSGRSTRD